MKEVHNFCNNYKRIVLIYFLINPSNLSYRIHHITRIKVFIFTFCTYKHTLATYSNTWCSKTSRVDTRLFIRCLAIGSVTSEYDECMWCWHLLFATSKFWSLYQFVLNLYYLHFCLHFKGFKTIGFWKFVQAPCECLFP